MRALVTGCAGFIGSHLTERLLADGHQVVGIDCFTGFYSRTIKEKNLSKSLSDDDFIFHGIDLLDMNLDEVIGRGDIDWIFHQAAQPGVLDSWGDRFSVYVEDNILGTQRLLEACKGKGIEKFIYASSSSVYGNVDPPMREESLPKPFSPYGVSKLAGEHLCGLYEKNFNVPCISLRYFTVYGPRQRPDMAIGKFLRAVKDNRKIEIYGDGEQSRDFTYVDDIVEANILAVNSEEKGVFNTGGGSRITMNELLKVIEKVTGKEIEATYISPKKGDVRHTRSDNSLAMSRLGYSPKVLLEDGIRKQWEWICGNS